MMDRMNARRHQNQSQRAIQASWKSNVGVGIQGKQRVGGPVGYQCPRQQAEHDCDRHVDQQRGYQFYRVVAQPSRDVHDVIKVMHAVQAPKPRRLMKKYMRRIADETLNRNGGNRSEKPPRTTQQIQQADTIMLRPFRRPKRGNRRERKQSQIDKTEAKVRWPPMPTMRDLKLRRKEFEPSKQGQNQPIDKGNGGGPLARREQRVLDEVQSHCIPHLQVIASRT